MLRRRLFFTKSECKAWHLVLAVIVMGLTLRMALGNLELPSPYTPSLTYHYLANAKPMPVERAQLMLKAPECRLHPEIDSPIIEIIPLDLNGDVPGPLLSSILKRYMPDATAMHADELRDTLPPGQNPRMIVILPKEETPKPM